MNGRVGLSAEDMPSFTDKNVGMSSRDSELAYFLHHDISYRRERFGCAVLSRARGATRFYNDAASAILEACIHPRTVGELYSRLTWDKSTNSEELAEFLDKLADDEVLEKIAVGSIPEKSEVRTFFTDVTEFPSTHLYAPLAVEAEITLKCFRSCSYCAYGSFPGFDISNDLSSDEWASTLAHLRDSGVFYIRFTGGDPFARKDFPEILSAADALGLLITVGSDLTVLTEDHADHLASLQHLLVLQTTLDGSTPDTADTLRGNGNFARVERGAKLLHDRKVPFVVGTVLHRDNKDDIPSIARLVASWGAAGYMVAPLYPAGRGNALNDLVLSNEELAEANRSYRRLVSDGVIPSADPSWNMVTADMDEEELDSLWADQPYLVREPDRLMRIDPRGRCYTSIKLKDVVHDDVFAGNIREQPLLQIWHDAPQLVRLRGQNSHTSGFGPTFDIRTADISGE
jgi:MoaA/NifB/PqqE/SkfB family radical SAM enzyme